MHLLVLLFVTMFSLSSCNKKVKISGKTQNNISGSVYEFTKINSVLDTSSEQNNCIGSYVELYLLDENGKKQSKVATTTLNSLGKFSFSSINGSKINLNKDLKRPSPALR